MNSRLFWSSFLILALLTGCSSKQSTNELVTTPYVDSEPEIELPQETRVSLIAVGDNLIHETIYLDAKQADGSYDFTPIYQYVSNTIEKADIAFINQETLLGGDELGISGYPTFNTPSCMANQLISIGFNMFNQASNHSMDKGRKGVENAVGLWRELMETNDIIMSGLYDSEDDRNTIRTLTVKGITFALLDYTHHTNGIKIPEEYMLGTFYDLNKVKEDVQHAKEIADVVIVGAHWGTEDTFEVNNQQKELAHMFNELGVDVVIGYGPHVIQPIEYLTNDEGKETVIAYSLGNFISGMLYPYDLLGGMLGLEFVKAPDSNTITIENVSWTPIVSYYEGNSANIIKERYNYRVLPLSMLTEEMAAAHALNGYDGRTVSVSYFVDKTSEIIKDTATINW